MPRTSKLLTEKQQAIAEENGIPRVTVYKRIKAGWDVEEAITKPTRKAGNRKRKDGLFVDTGKAKARFFSLTQEWDDKLAKEIADSDLSESEWIERVIIDRLKSKKQQTK
ncbi:hypothetical protein I4641_15695 [Waterburya agarophytonicola K14]|uniref:Uncharacterized protein n=1 Tax=Waterburya agarophytonicola KI4 TaxID=2874699 RepID=A0A964FGS8_9CYAN|nr:hypothetical protein [Waterburya agarophytonicola]MCC0178421.1 hypothetical protein [Waterburya agarophytonicola KI4]